MYYNIMYNNNDKVWVINQKENKQVRSGSSFAQTTVKRHENKNKKQRSTNNQS